MKPNLVPFGDSALLIQFGDEVDPLLNQRVHSLDRLIAADPKAGVVEAVPAYATLLIHYDPLRLSYVQLRDWVDPLIDRIESNATRPPRRLEVPVRYGGEGAMDLEFVAAAHQLSPHEVARLHAGREYTVYMMGFTPGFAYMGKLDDRIATGRLETPRTRVAAGSVGIAGLQTGIYPIDSPGGWRIIGLTRLHLFDLNADPPILFSPGDSVRFVIEAVDV